MSEIGAASSRRTRGCVRILLLVAALALSSCVGWRPSTAGGAAPSQTRSVEMIGGIPSSGTTYAASQRVLVRSADGTLYLAHVVRIDGVDQVYVARSQDGGRIWYDFTQISSGETSSSNPDLVIGPKGALRVFWTKHETYPPTGEPSTGWSGAGSAAARERSRAAEEAAAKNGFRKPGQSAGGEPVNEYGTVRQLFMSTFNGRKWSRQLQLTHGDYNGFPSAAYDSHGVLHLVWYGYDGHNYQVIYAALARGHWSKPRQISEGFPDSVNPTIAVDGEDNLHVAWYKYSPATKSYQIFYREYLAAKRRWSSEDEQISEGLEQAENVSIAVDSSNHVWVAWQGQVTSSAASAIFVRELRNGKWSGQTQVSPAGHPSPHSPPDRTASSSSSTRTMPTAGSTSPATKGRGGGLRCG